MASKSLVNRLNKRITIRKQTWIENSMKEKKQSWIDYASVWAAIEPLRGQESLIAQKSESTVTTRIRIRFREGIEPSMMIDYHGVSFEIMYIIHPDFNKRELQLMCKERR